MDSSPNQNHVLVLYNLQHIAISFTITPAIFVKNKGATDADLRHPEGTGNTGGALVQILAQDPKNILHVYARSKAKLLEAHPVLGGPSSPHKLFIGELDDADLFAQCIRDTSAVFGMVGTNTNNPNLHLAEKLAKAISGALKKLKNETPSFKVPVTVFVTSAGMATDPRVGANFPGYLHWVLGRVGKYIYEDFRVAMRVFHQPENAWIPVIFACAPGLMPGPSQGKVKIGNDVPKKAPQYVSYQDLARGIFMAVEEQETWRGKEIGFIGAKMPKIDYGLMDVLFHDRPDVCVGTADMAVWQSP